MTRSEAKLKVSKVMERGASDMEREKLPNHMPSLLERWASREMDRQESWVRESRIGAWLLGVMGAKEDRRTIELRLAWFAENDHFESVKRYAAAWGIGWKEMVEISSAAGNLEKASRFMRESNATKEEQERVAFICMNRLVGAQDCWTHRHSELAKWMEAQGEWFKKEQAYDLLMNACAKNSPQWAFWMLKEGLNLDALISLGKPILAQELAASLAISFEETFSVQLLDVIKEQSPQAWIASMQGTLEASVKKNKASVVARLIFLGADPYEKNSDGRDAFEVAAFNGTMDALNELLMQFPGRLRESRPEGSLLHYSIKGKQLWSSQWLVGRGVDFLETNQDGETALHLCLGLMEDGNHGAWSGLAEFLMLHGDRVALDEALAKAPGTPGAKRL